MSLGKSTKTPELTSLTLPNFLDSFPDYLKQQQYIPELGAMMEQMNTTANSIFQRALAPYAPTAQQDIVQSGKNASALLQGQLPQDVSDYITRQATARSYATGVGPTSGMGRNMTLRDLGLNSLQGMTTGQNMLTQQLSLAKAMNPYNYDVLGQNIFSTKDITERKDAQAEINWQIENQNNAIRAANKAQSSGIGSLIGGVLGGGLGLLGGPVGAGIGMSLGSQFGNALEGGTPTGTSSGLTSVFSQLGGLFKSTPGNDFSNMFSTSPSAYRY